MSTTFEIDGASLIAAASAFGGAFAAGLVAAAKIIARALDRSTDALLENARSGGRVEAAVVERIEREISGVVDVPIAATQAATPRLRQYPRLESKPKGNKE